MSWPLVELCEVARLINGRAYNKDELLNEGKYPVLRVGNFFSNRGWYFSDLELDDKNYCSDGDLLYAWSASFGPKIWDGEKTIFHYHIWKLELNSSLVDKKYLYHALFFDVEKIKREQGSGSTMIHVTKAAMEKRKIPLPPLAEQKRIAAILDKADAIRRKRQQAIKLADEFLRSVFLDMFGDPVTNPKGWEVFRMDDVVETQLGKMLSEKSRSGKSPKIYLRNANVRWRSFQLDDLLRMDFDEKEMSKFKLINGDLLVCEGGEVGRCAIWKSQVSDCYYQKALHRVRVKNDLLTPEYLQEYFYWAAKLGGLAESVSEVTFSHLTAEKLKELKIPIPPISKQKQFSILYNQVEKMRDCFSGATNKKSDLFNSLSQKAFSGSL